MPVLFRSGPFPDKMESIVSKVKVISFDAEGTVVTPQFSTLIWYEAIPLQYARQRGIGVDEGREEIKREYSAMGMQRVEWYDVRYWFEQFSLPDYKTVLDAYRHAVNLYPETEETLVSLSRSCSLVVTSASSRDFLDLLLSPIRGHFRHVFSCISDYRLLKTADFYHRVCDTLGVCPEEVVHIGDNWNGDYLAPREIGMRAFYLDRNGERGGEDVVRSLTEFQQIMLTELGGNGGSP
ncbi:MAG: HAD-superfamily hydrolase, subfamily variant 1 [Dehalococcoidia bacterium]|nr:HAD-superfamily hydrolase, subfamily variant 1 [Dehalococcoidia bacterium]